MDKGIQDVQRKFALRDVPGVLIDEGEERERFVEKVEKGEKGGKGYTAFVEAARDLERLVDVVWVSGTRTFLRSLTMLICFHNTKGECAVTRG